MNQYLFEDWLRNRLDDLPPEELDRVVAFYLDAIAARMEDGMRPSTIWVNRKVCWQVSGHRCRNM